MLQITRKEESAWTTGRGGQVARRGSPADPSRAGEPIGNLVPGMAAHPRHLGRQVVVHVQHRPEARNAARRKAKSPAARRKAPSRPPSRCRTTRGAAVAVAVVPRPNRTRMTGALDKED